MAEADIDRITEQVASATFPNPRPVTAEGVRDLLRAAWAGTQPTA
jgi:maleylacetate reductase